MADRWNRSSRVGTWPARCDVVVTNLTSPRQKRFGLRYEDISPSNPRVIYLALNGYGVEGPERDRLGFDYAAFWSRSGIMGSLGEPDSPPIQQRPGMGDQTTSLTLAAAIGFALYERERSGKGQRIDCSLLHTALWVLGPDIAAALQTGAPVRRESEKFWPQFCRATGLEELILDTRFDSHLHRIKHCEELIGILDERFATKTAEEWGSRLDASGCIWAPVQTLDQVVVDPQVQANDYLVSLHDETNGSIQVMSAPIRFQQTPGQVRKPAPELGQDTEMALLELGYSWEKVAIMKDEGAIIS